MDQLGQGVMGVWRSQPPSPTTICTTKAGDNWVDSLKQWEHSGSAFSHAEVWPPPPPEVKRCSLRVTGSVGLFLIHQNKKTSVCDVLSHTVITHFYGCDFPLVWSKTQVLWGEYERNLSAVFVLGGGREADTGKWSQECGGKCTRVRPHEALRELHILPAETWAPSQCTWSWGEGPEPSGCACEKTHVMHINTHSLCRLSMSCLLPHPQMQFSISTHACPKHKKIEEVWHFPSSLIRPKIKNINM